MDPIYSVLCREDGVSSEHIFFKRSFSKHIWDLCTRTFGLNINITLNENLCNKIDKCDSEMQRVMTIIAAYCWKVWRGRNSRIFNASHHSIGYCMCHIVHNNIFWAGIPSDEERLYLLDISLGNELDSTPHIR